MKQHATFCCLVAFLGANLTDAAVGEDLASLRKKIINNLSTIASIEVRYQTSPLPVPVQKRFGLSPSESGVGKPRFEIWMKDGEREFYELSAIQNSATKHYERRRFSFDGRQYYRAHFSPDDPDLIDRVDIRKVPLREDFVRASVPALLVGLHVWETHLTLIELLNRSAATYLGEEEVGDHRCHKIDTGEYEGFTDHTFRMLMWADPNVDLLPRKVEFRVVRNLTTNATVALPPVVKSYEVQDFIEVEDAALKRKRWFPKIVPHGLVGITINEVRINHQIDKSRFTPKIPDGTQLIYGDQRELISGTARTRMKMEVSGGEKGTEILIKRSEAASERANQKRLQDYQSEHARNSRILWMLMVGFGVVAVAVVWKWSSKRTQ